MSTDIDMARAEGERRERAAVIDFLERLRPRGNANQRAAWDDMIAHIRLGHHIDGIPMPF